MSYGNEGVNLTMPVEPSGYGNNNGFGFGGDNGWWILLLFLFGMNGGWGNNGGYGGGNGLYPWMNQADITTSGFQNQMLNTQLMGIQNSVTAGFGDVQNSLCSGFAGVNANISNGFAQAEIGENARQMANMQQLFGLQSSLQQCCCDNRAGIADLKFTVAQENCADRAAVSDGIRDVIANQTANTQAVLDKLCALELDGYKRENDNLRQQLNMSQLAASQIEQTAQIRAGQASTANQLVNELRSCPIPSQPVYGNQPIFSCQPNYGGGCGCGCGVA
jgi:hypothetical protein